MTAIIDKSEFPSAEFIEKSYQELVDVVRYGSGKHEAHLGNDGLGSIKHAGRNPFSLLSRAISFVKGVFK